jgi:hypothetical protein
MLIFVSSTMASLLIGGLLMASHMPFRANPTGLAAFVRELAPTAGRWEAVHLLSASCSCSQAVAEHLIQRGRIPNLSERVILAGQDSKLAQRLAAAGFPVETREPESIASRYKILGAPWLLFVSPHGEIRYQGGYAPGHERNNFEDVQIWRKLLAGETVSELPVRGCALGPNLQRMIDPFRLKYSRAT